MKEKNFQINNDANTYEIHVADEITRSINDLSSFLPKIKWIISPIVATEFELQSSKKKILRKGMHRILDVGSHQYVLMQ